MYISLTTKPIFSNLVCKVLYMKGIKHVNLIEITPVVIEIRGVENGELTVPVNIRLVYPVVWLLFKVCTKSGQMTI